MLKTIEADRYAIASTCAARVNAKKIRGLIGRRIGAVGRPVQGARVRWLSVQSRFVASSPVTPAYATSRCAIAAVSARTFAVASLDFRRRQAKLARSVGASPTQVSRAGGLEASVA
jgi:hypothetical protein